MTFRVIPMTRKPQNQEFNKNFSSVKYSAFKVKQEYVIMGPPEIYLADPCR